MDYDDNPNIVKRFWHFITFKIYHNNLLTTGGASYLFMMSVIVSLVALSEAVAWGYFGGIFTPENPFIGGTILGAFVFLIMWFFDRTMATQDLLANEHAYTLEGEQKPNSFWLKYNVGTYFIFLGRLGIVIGSLYLTSDYLTQFAFRSDIKKEMEAQYQQNIENAKQLKIGELDKKISEQENYLKLSHDKLQKEIGGKRGNGYGKGAVAKSIESELLSVESNLNALKAERQNTELAINNAIKSNDEKALKTFGIEAVKDSPIFRQKAIDKFSQDPAFQKRKLSIEGFLAIFGIILILMKILQPKTLQLYYSARLQEAWEIYKTGSYDDYLNESEKSVNQPKNPMPQTFERIIIRYAQTKDEREANERRAKRQQLEEKQKEAERQRAKKEQDEQLEQSRQEWAERVATENQGLEYESKVRHHRKAQIERAKSAIKVQLAEFLQENSEKINELQAKRQQIFEEIAEATRTYNSKQEDANARQERLDNANGKLLELQNIADELNQAGGTTVGDVQSYRFTQRAIESQKQVIKNLQDNYLTFERDMNFYAQKIQNLNEQKTEVERELLSLKAIWDALKQAYQNQQLAEIELLGTVNLNSPYLYGSEAEIPYLAQKVKNNEAHHYYVEGNPQNAEGLEHKQ